MIKISENLIIIVILLSLSVLTSCGGGGEGGASVSDPPSQTTQKSIIVAGVESQDNPVIAVSTDNLGLERIALVGEKDSQGIPVSLIKILYVSTSGDAGELELDNNGLPASLSDAVGNKITFSNYTDTTVEVNIYDYLGVLVLGPTISAIDTNIRTELLGIKNSSILASKKTTRNVVSLFGLSSQEWVKLELNTAGLALSLAGCVTAVTPGAAITGPLYVMAASLCVSTLVSAAIQIKSIELPSLIKFSNVLASGGHCALGLTGKILEFTKCFGFILKSLDFVILDDVKSPSTPGEIKLSSATSGSVGIYWGGSTDDVGISGYHVYRNDAQYDDVPITFYRDISIVPGETYCYNVVAYDAVNHESDKNDELCVKAPSVIPVINATNPENNAENVAIESEISATFDQPMDSSTLTEADFTISGPNGVVSGSVTYNELTNTAILAPDASFTGDTMYTATLTTNVKNVLGNTLADNYLWSFTTSADPPNSFSGIINTVAGNGALTFSGDGGAATNAALIHPRGVALDSVGNMYIADSANHRIRKVDINGVITTVAGNGSVSFSGDNGPATSAGLQSPFAVVGDAIGNLYIADTFHNRIRKVDINGIISTIAGNGSAGFSGDGGPAISAQLYLPYGIAVDNNGAIYISDTSNRRVRKVDSNGLINTIAGIGATGSNGDGGLAINAKLTPYGISVDGAGNVYFVDASGGRIRKIDTGGLISTVAGKGGVGFSGDGGMATEARLAYPYGVALDGSGNIYIADSSNNRIRKVDTTGIITTIAGNGDNSYSGDGGPAISAALKNPSGVTVTDSGIIYIADTNNNRIRKFDNNNE